MQAIALWFRLGRFPRFSIDLKDSNYAVVCARDGDHIRLIVGTSKPPGVGGTHVGLTLAQARTMRDGLTRLLEDVDSAS